MWLFGYFLNFLKMVILELRYSGTEPSILDYLKVHYFAVEHPYPGMPRRYLPENGVWVCAALKTLCSHLFFSSIRPKLFEGASVP